ncbi:MAG: rhomboid family intramembrane serine protease [Myxococcaceae bacterium]
MAAFLLRDRLTREEPPFGETGLGTLYGPLVADGQWWRVLGMVFEHGGITHLALNMWALVSLGSLLERVLGRAQYGLICLMTALGASGTVLLLAFNKPTVGASGMILGLAGALVPIMNKQGRANLFQSLLPTVLISLLPGVSWQGHLGGFVWGLFCGLALRAGPHLFWRIAAGLMFGAASMVVLATKHPLRM